MKYSQFVKRWFHDSTATILPKGGPPCSLWAGYSDFHQLSRQSLSYTSIPLVPKLLKPLDKERDTAKNNTEKVPISPPVIVCALLTTLRRKNLIIVPVK